MFIRCVALALAVAGFAIGASAQRESEGKIDFKKVENLYLDDVHAGEADQRRVLLYVRALTGYGVSVPGIGPEDIEVWQDDDLIDPGDIEIEPLEATGRGVAAVLAIDASGTMKGEPFDRAKDAALAFLERLRPEDRVAIVSFADDVRVVAEFDLQRAETRQALRTLEIDPERSQHTLLYDGAYQAVDLIRDTPDLPRRSFIILFSDGKDDGSDRSRDQVVRACEGKPGEPHVLIFAIGYARFGGTGLVEMQRLADGTGGDFLEAASMVYLRDFFDAIATQVLKSYVLGFDSSMDGEEHELRVTIGTVTSSRRAVFPDFPMRVWPWLLGLAVVLLGVGIFFAMRATQTRGRLSIVSGAKAGTVYALKSGRTRIGALDENDIALPSGTVSRYHAEILTRGRQIQIADLNSRNGTMVNGQRVQESPLQPGDRITIADVEMVYER